MLAVEKIAAEFVVAVESSVVAFAVAAADVVVVGFAVVAEGRQQSLVVARIPCWAFLVSLD